MKTAARLVSLVGTFVLAVAAPAFAGPYPLPTQNEEVLPTVVAPAAPQASEGGLAFTGAEMTLLFAILAILVITGLAALFAARRQARVPA